MPEMICKTCLHFKPYGDRNDEGECEYPLPLWLHLDRYTLPSCGNCACWADKDKI